MKNKNNQKKCCNTCTKLYTWDCIFGTRSGELESLEKWLNESDYCSKYKCIKDDNEQENKIINNNYGINKPPTIDKSKSPVPKPSTIPNKNN